MSDQKAEFREYQYKLFTECGSITLSDDDASISSTELWKQAQPEQVLAVDAGVVSVRTSRNCHVRVLVDVRESEPGETEPGLFFLGQCALDVPSGKIVVAGSADYYPDAARIPVRPALYGVRIYAGSLDTVGSGMRASQDHIRVILWLF